MSLPRYVKPIFSISLGALLFAIIVVKAYQIPITHDERHTMLYFAAFHSGEIIKAPDASTNNHILNTLLIRKSFKLFGVSAFAGRLPSILSFLLYFSITWLITRRYFGNSLLYFAGSIALLCNPFVLDFFSLGRGYAMSAAFTLASVYFLLRFVETNKLASFFSTLLLSMLASYANFSLLIFFTAINFLMVLKLFFIYRDKELKPGRIIIAFIFQVVLDVGFALLCYTPIIKMQSGGLFGAWVTHGFYNTTVLELVSSSCYGSRSLGIPVRAIAMFVVLLFFVMLLFVTWRLFTKKFNWGKDLLTFSFLTLLITILVNLAQTTFLHSSNLIGRMAIGYYPLFVVPLLFSLREVEFRNKLAANITAVVISVYGLLHFATKVNMKMVYEWRYDQSTFVVMDYLNNYRQAHSLNKIELNTSWWFSHSFRFYTETGKVKWLDVQPYHIEVDTTTNTQFYYCVDKDYPHLKNKYIPVMTFDNGVRMLLIHK